MSLTAGLVGLPNVGKSTLFNAITNSQVEAANYPFATIQPNVGTVEVSDPRLIHLTKLFKSEKTVYATADMKSPFDCIERFCAETESLLKKYPEAKPTSIGISCGGPLDSKRGIVMSPPNLPGWDNIPVCELLNKRFSIPVRLCNDADACAVAEWKFGAGRGAENMAFLTFGTGLGAGLILGGKLYSGASGMAGECGHIRLAEDGPVGYGKHGSFEGFCSGGGIARMGRAYAEKHLPLSWCPTAADLDSISAKTIAEAALAGDESARMIYEECGRREEGYGQHGKSRHQAV